MKIIEITVGNKKYKISCNPGEESHIFALSRKLDKRYKNLAANLGDKASEGLILVIMGLMQEDELINSTNANGKQKKSLPNDQILSLSRKVDNTITKLENLKLL